MRFEVPESIQSKAKAAIEALRHQADCNSQFKIQTLNERNAVPPIVLDSPWPEEEEEEAIAIHYIHEASKGLLYNICCGNIMEYMEVVEDEEEEISCVHTANKGLWRRRRRNFTTSMKSAKACEGKPVIMLGSFHNGHYLLLSFWKSRDAADCFKFLELTASAEPEHFPLMSQNGEEGFHSIHAASKGRLGRICHDVWACLNTPKVFWPCAI